MDEKLKARYKELKAKNQLKLKEKLDEDNFYNNELLQECIKFTGAEVFMGEASDLKYKEIQENIIYNKYARVEPSQFKVFKEIDDIKDELEAFDLSQEYYVIWESMGLPCLKCSLDKLIEFIDDVTAMSFDTWFISCDYNIVIEFRHGVRVGIK